MKGGNDRTRERMNEGTAERGNYGLRERLNKWAAALLLPRPYSKTWLNVKLFSRCLALECRWPEEGGAGGRFQLRTPRVPGWSATLCFPWALFLARHIYACRPLCSVVYSCGSPPNEVLLGDLSGIPGAGDWGASESGAQEGEGAEEEEGPGGTRAALGLCPSNIMAANGEPPCYGRCASPSWIWKPYIHI